ncbi:S-layer homology domain-containing protein [Paenibacillus alkaliterrae]
MNCAAKGTINGYSDGTFRPNKAITGAELTAIANGTFFMGACIQHTRSH